MLGIGADALADGMDQAKLRSIYRARSRQVHPDLVGGEAEGGAVTGGDEAAWGEGEAMPTIYDINQAYESLKKIL